MISWRGLLLDIVLVFGKLFVAVENARHILDCFIVQLDTYARKYLCTKLDSANMIMHLRTFKFPDSPNP